MREQTIGYVLYHRSEVSLSVLLGNLFQVTTSVYLNVFLYRNVSLS